MGQDKNSLISEGVEEERENTKPKKLYTKTVTDHVPSSDQNTDSTQPE